MWDSIGNKTCLLLHIASPDDNRNTIHRTRVDVYADYELPTRGYRYFDKYARASQIGLGKSHTQDGDKLHHIQVEMVRQNGSKGDPLITNMNRILQHLFGWGGRGWKIAPKTFKIGFHLPDTGIGWVVEKNDPYYTLGGIRTKKKQLLTIISRTLYRSCFEDDGSTLLKYHFKMINLPENVTYALENRTPFWFFTRVNDSMLKMEVRLNTKLIDNDECALEISDGIWAPITVKDLDIFINYYYHGHNRTERFKALSPKKLWEELMDEKPNSSQQKLMVEFLIQNRTQKIVEDRAQQLMLSMVDRYPDKIKIIPIMDSKEKREYEVMLVRGKACDWLIVDSAYKSNIQKVKTYVYIDREFFREDKEGLKPLPTFGNGALRGPICIDNVHDNSSLGDQYVTRALALLNDKTTFKLVNTIAKYIPKEIQEGSGESRFDFENMSQDSVDWSVIM